MLVLKAFVAVAVALAFVMPVAAVANVGTIGVISNIKNTSDINNIEESTNSDITETIIISDTSVNSDTKDTELPTLPALGTIYVDDDADPSWYNATQVKTIQEGVNNATAGYTVYVYNGTYRERVIVDIQLDLIGESRENVIVDGYGGGYPFKVTANDVSIDTFTIMNGSYAIYLYKPSNTVVINCDVYNNTNYAIYASQSSNNIITNCNTYNNKRGIYLTGSSDNIITNCNVYNNSNYGIYITTSSNSNITNCNVYNNIEYGLYIYKSSGCELRDNTIHNNVYNFAVEGTSVSDFNQDIDISNMVDGKPIFYLIGQSNLTLDETNNFGYLGLISCTNITAKNSDVSGIIMIDTTGFT